MKEEEEVEIEEEKGGFWRKIKPTSLTAYTFEVIFVLGLIMSMLNFPYLEFMAGNLQSNISFGWPWSFFDMNIQNPAGFPVNFIGLVLDLLLYFAISYAFDLAISSISRAYKKNQRKN